MKLKNLTDAELYQKCKKYAANTRLWMRKFEALLPEVYERGLYKRRGFASIHEFAAKLAGMNNGKVDRILQLAKKLSDKPELKKTFESGEVGYSKIAKVAYVAKAENEGIWAKKVRQESQLALEMLVKKERESNREESVLKNTLQPDNFTKLTFRVSTGTEIKFRALKQKLEKKSGEALSYGEVLGELLEGVKVKPTEGAMIQMCPECAAKKAESANGRYVSIGIKRLVLARQGYSCAHEGCTYPPAELHHINGYALNKTHSPEGLQYLCKNHHAQSHAFHEHVQKFRR